LLTDARVIASQLDIDLVLNPKLRRRMLRLPASGSPKERCPLRVGAVYNLQPRAFTKGQVVITVTNAYREPLDALTVNDARREGHGGVQGALEAWRRSHGLPKGGQLVWVVEFVRGDESEWVNSDQPVYLAKYGGDYTTNAAKQAVRGDPELAMPLPGAAETARVMALATRQAPAARSIGRVREEVETLREAMTTMRARNRVKLITRELGKLASELPVTQVSTVPTTPAPMHGTAPRAMP
jgi:hypothetical protein